MPQKSSLISQFWQELKRRRVVHVITVYASAAFVIIELINNLTEPLNLPPGLSTIVVVILAVGFPLAVILAWIYDLTPEGMEKTKSVEEIEEGEKTVVPNAWKIATYVSFVVIVGLVVLNIVGGSKMLKAGDIQSLVILPFDNFTGDDSLEYFVSGMHASLINDVGRLSGLRVTCKTSSNVYKDVDITASEIASDLNVDAVMETSVMSLGDTIWIQYKLVDARGKERQLYFSDIKEEESKILGFFNQITRQIAEELIIKITPNEERLLAKSRTVDREAYNEYLKARSYWSDFRRESLFKALDYLNSAIEKEPDWAPLYAGLAELWMWIQQAGYESPSVAAPKIYENLNKAMELDPDLAEVHYLSAMIAHLVEWNWEKSEKEFLKALAINPSNALSRMLYSQLLLILQRNDEALAQRELAVSLDPLNPATKLLYAGTLAQAGDFKAALPVAEELVAAVPEDMNANFMIEIAAYRLKEYDKVIRSVKYTLPFLVEEDIYDGIVRIYNESGIVAAYEEIMKHLEKYIEYNPISAMDIAMRYIMANQPDKAMDWIEKGFELHDPQITYITATGRFYEQLFGNPRFIDIVRENEPTSSKLEKIYAPKE